MGWYFGFKLHLICNERGELLNYTVKVRNKVLEVSEATIAKWNDIDGGDVGADL